MSIKAEGERRRQCRELLTTLPFFSLGNLTFPPSILKCPFPNETVVISFFTTLICKDKEFINCNWPRFSVMEIR